jgi:hypothetical protein
MNELYNYDLNNNAVIKNNYGRLQDILLFRIPMGT